MASGKKSSRLNLDGVLDTSVGQDVTRQRYDNWSKTYDEDVKVLGINTNDYVAMMLDDLLEGNKDAYIFDNAAGTGLTGIGLQKLGYHNMDAADGSEHMLEKARAKNIYKKLSKVWLGKDKFDIPENTYDMVNTTGAFIPTHISEEGFYSFRDMVRITKPGGIVTGQVRYEAGTGGFVNSTFNNKVTAEFDKLVQEGLAEWIHKGEPRVIHEGVQPFLVWTLRVK